MIMLILLVLLVCALVGAARACALLAPVQSHAATTEKKATALDGIIAVLKEAKTSDHPGAMLDKASQMLGKELKKNAKTDKEKAVKAHLEKAQKAAPKFEQDIRKVMDDKSIDIISIATPNHWHALAAVWAMRAGKHVYCEKPATHNVHEGRLMVQASRKYKKTLRAL